MRYRFSGFYPVFRLLSGKVDPIPRSTPTIDQTPRPDKNVIHARGNCDPRQGPREGLFGFMGMHQNAQTQACAIRGQDLPPIGVMVPTGVGVAQREVKAPRTASLNGFGSLNFRFIS
jgi:hypothetical protein